MLLGGMLLAGLAGSVAHCSFMCGPFVLGQVGARLARVPASRLCEQARLREALLLPYHLGRITTYAAIGAVAAGLSGAARAWVGSASAWLLLAGAVLFALQGLHRLWPALHIGGVFGQASGWLAPFRRMAGRLDVTRPGGALLLGLALGGLPCVFLYSAVFVASSAATAAGGALGMAVFGLGTVPALVLVGVAGHQAGRRWNGLVGKSAPYLLLANAILLLVMAGRSFATSL